MGEQQTSGGWAEMVENDPERRFAAANYCIARGLLVQSGQ